CIAQDPTRLFPPRHHRLIFVGRDTSRATWRNSMSDLSETAAVKVVDGFTDFRLAAHDEWAVAENWLFDRITRQHQHYAVAIGMDFNLRAIALEADDFRFSSLFAAIDRHMAGQHRNHRSMAFRQIERDVGTSAEPYIPDIHRTKCARRTARACEVTRNDTHPAGTMAEIDNRNVSVGNRLVAGRRHFVLGRQVHPQLDHPEWATGLGEGLGMKLLMNDTACTRRVTM